MLLVMSDGVPIVSLFFMTVQGWWADCDRTGTLFEVGIIHSDDPSELSQWLCHDDSTIDIVLVIVIRRSIVPVINLLTCNA